MKGFLLKLEFEERVLEKVIDDSLFKSMQKLHNVHLIASGLAFFQRFFLHQTLFTMPVDHIQHVLDACLFLSTKVSEIENFNNESFCARLELDPIKANLCHYENLVVNELKFQFHVHTPIQSVKSLIYRLEVAILGLQPNLSKRQLEEFSAEIRQEANLICLASYKRRELTFCVSPALIAMAAVDLKLKKGGHKCRQLHAQMFNSLRDLLEATLSPAELTEYLGPDPEALWQKLASVEAKLEANKSDKKTGSKIIKLLDRK